MKKTNRSISAILGFFILFFPLLISSPVHVSASNDFADIAMSCYTFTPGVSNSQRLDVSGGNFSNGTNVQTWSANGTISQMFYVVPERSGWYRICNIISQKVIDVAGGDMRSGTNVQIYDWNGTDAQLWRFRDAGNGYYYIENKSGFFLDVGGGGTTDGTNVQIYEGNRTSAQKWKLEPCEGIYTFISGLSSSKCMDVFNGSFDNGSNIHLWSTNNTAAQRFLVKKESSGWYSILNIASGKAIDVCSAKVGSGVNVQLYDYNKTDAQLWKFYSAGNGYYYIQNKLGYYLDVNTGNTADGTNIQVYDGNGTAAQKWKLCAADLTENMFTTLMVDLYEKGLTYQNDPLGKLIFYFQNFRTGSIYDIKNANVWNNLFPEIEYPGFQGVILYDNIFMTPEQLGNYIYGFSGRLLGFSDRTIYQGGGYAASGKTYLSDPSNYYGDSAIDHEYIRRGIERTGKNGTIDVDISRYKNVLDVASKILS